MSDRSDTGGSPSGGYPDRPGQPMKDPPEARPPGEPVAGQPASNAPSEPGTQRLRDYLHERFGSGYEAITGFSGFVYKHEDAAARVWLFSSVFWFIVVTTFGMIIATELVDPEFLGGTVLEFGRTRPMHVQGVLYAWLTMMYWGAIFYFSPRLLGTTRMWSESLGVWTGWLHNVVMAVGIGGIAFGLTTGREWQELPWIIAVFVLLVFLSNTVNIIATVRVRKVRPLYVSMWWAIAAPIWLMGSLFIGHVMWSPGPNIFGNPSSALSNGIHDAMINWWGNHNLFGLWLTPVLIAVVYYFVPRMTNTPLYSYTLSLISFWGIIFIYTAVGDHHLLQSPTPGWLKTIASVNSVGILIPVFAFFTNVFLTMRGQWNKFFTSLELRFVLTGFIFYILANIQGALQAVQPFNVYIHFTYFIIGHSHLALLGGFTILGMGVVYHMLPRILGKPIYSRALAEWQFWLVSVGWIVMLVALSGGAFVQGQGWMMGVNEVLILPSLRLWNLWRGIAGGLIYGAAWLQGINIVLTVVTDTNAVRARRAGLDSHSAFASQPEAYSPAPVQS